MQDWDEIKQRHGPDVWAVICRIVRCESDALDCYQEVFLEAFRKELANEISNLPGLLRWLAVRRAIDMLRRNRNRPKTLPDNGALNRIIDSDTVDVSFDYEELLNRVREELRELPPKQAEAFWLCCVEQLSYRDAGAAMGQTPKHVGVLVHRARKHLRIALAELIPREVQTLNRKEIQ